MARPAAGLAAGVLLGLGSVQLDALIPQEAVPGLLRFEAGTAQVLLATFAGAVVTIAGFTFWMRSIMVQLASAAFSPRVLAAYLQDRFQQSVMGFMIAALAFIVVVLRAVPVGSSGPVPGISVVAAVVTTIVALTAMLVAMRRSVYAMQVGELVRRMAESAVDMVRDHEARITRRPAPTTDVLDGSVMHVASGATGWVAAVDDEALMRSLPRDAHARLEVRVGVFVVDETPILAVDTDRPESVDTDGVRRSIRIARQRDRARDVQLRIQELVDIGEQALAMGSKDATAAYEVIAHMGWVMREVLVRDATPTGFEDEAGRVLLRPCELTPRDFLRAGFERLRASGAPWPNVAHRLLETLAFLRDELDRAGRADRVPAVEEAAQRVLETLDDGDALASEKERINALAKSLGLAPGSAAADSVTAVPG